MECKQCGNEFEAKRSTAMYCSEACKKRYQRLSGTEAVAKLSGTHPPYTPKQMTSPCTACIKFDTCSYLKNQISAVPGDANYAGVI